MKKFNENATIQDTLEIFLISEAWVDEDGNSQFLEDMVESELTDLYTYIHDIKELHKMIPPNPDFLSLLNKSQMKVVSNLEKIGKHH